MYRNFVSIYIIILNVLLLFVFDIAQLSMTIAWISIVFLNIFSLVSSYKRNSKQLFGHYIYFILYLCTLEIGPYILIYRSEERRVGKEYSYRLVRYQAQKEE